MSDDIANDLCGPMERDTIHSLVAEGREFFAAGNLDAAEHCFRKALALEPVRPDIINDLGCIYFQKGEPQKAEENFLLCQRLAPKYLAAIVNLAELYKKQGRYDDELRYRKKAVTVDERNPSLWNALGLCLLELGDFNEMRSAFSRSFSLDGDQAEIRTILDEIVKAQAGRPSDQSISSSSGNEASVHRTAGVKPKLSIMYHQARTGGTIITKCLGAIPGNIVLSEVNPRGWAKDPVQQAYEWFQLLSKQEMNEIKASGPHHYVEVIQLISNRCLGKGFDLIIRDWSHLDFIAVPFDIKPSCRLEQYELLKDYFDLRQIASVRHPLDTYLSMRGLEIMQNKLHIDSFLKGTLAFARKAVEIGFERYEDFCAEPAVVLSRICRQLGVRFAESFLADFPTYNFITGDESGTRGGHYEIRPLPRRAVDPDLLRRFEADVCYGEIVELLRY